MQNTGQVSLGSAVAVLENHILGVWLSKDGAAGTSLPCLSVLGGHCSNLGTLEKVRKGKKKVPHLVRRELSWERVLPLTKIWEHQTLEFFKIFIFRTLNLLIKTV